MTSRRGPVIIETELPETGVSPDMAPPVPEADEPAPEGRAMQMITAHAAKKRSWAGRLFWSALTGLLGLMIGVAFWDFVTGLVVRNQTLGRVALVLAAVAAAMVLLFVLREAAALLRLGRIDRLRSTVDQVWRDPSRDAALGAVENLSAFYAGRPELRWALDTVRAQSGDIFDADALLGLAETQLLAPLDGMARAEIETAVRQVATATALVPLALADVAVALVVNIRMIRRVAGVYGGRAGYFGSLRLLRAVAAHLVATGAVAVGDDMIGSLAGGGVLSKISRRFGEGVVNGALTARVGLAAVEIVRPMPYRSEKRPRVTAIVGSALKGVFASGGDKTS